MGSGQYVIDGRRQHPETVVEERRVDDQGWQQPDHVGEGSAGEDHHPGLVTGPGDPTGGLGIGLEGSRADEFDSHHCPPSTHVADTGVLCLQREQSGQSDFADPSGRPGEIEGAEGVDGGQRRRTGDRTAP